MIRRARAWPLCAGLATACVLLPVAWAADAAPGSAVSPVSMWSLLQVLFGLGLVVLAIFATGWLLRRIGPGHSAGGVLRVIGGVMVGPRERLVLVEVGEQWLVLGVASGSVNLLHTLPRGATAAATAAMAQRPLRSGDTASDSTASAGGAAAAASWSSALDPAWLKRLLSGNERKP